MIVGVGADLCSIERIAGVIERKGARFIDRICTSAESSTWPPDPGMFFAKRFAAKEACAKALGTGITDRVRWHDIETVEQAKGLGLELKGGALRRLRKLTGRSGQFAHLFIRERSEYVQALVILENGCLRAGDLAVIVKEFSNREGLKL